jgi:hypothetical protein
MQKLEKAVDKTSEYYKNLETWFRDDFQRKRTVWMLVLTFGAIVSSIFTVLWFREQASSETGIKLTTAMAIFSEICKCAFIVNGWKNVKKHKMFGSFSIALAICFLAFSILASSGKLYTEKENRNKKSYVESAEYGTKQETKSREQGNYDETLSSIKETKRKIKDLEDNRETETQSIAQKYHDKYDGQIKRYEKKRRYTNGSEPLKRKRETEITQDITAYDKKIADLKADLKKYEADLKTTNNNLNNVESDLHNEESGDTVDTGYGSYFSSFMSTEKAKTLDGITYLIFGILVEISILVLSYYVFVVLPEEYGRTGTTKKINLNKPVTAVMANEIKVSGYKKRKGFFSSILKKNRVIESDLNQNENKKNNTGSGIGFKIDAEDKNKKIENIDASDIKKVLDIVYAEKKTNQFGELQSPSIDAIKKASGLTLKTTKIIMGMLERQGITNAINEPGKKRTVILMNRSEIGI